MASQSWNAGRATVLHSASEAVGRHITLIIPKDRHAEEERVLACLRRGERVDHFETVRIRKDGTSVDISLTVSPVLNTSGVVVGASKIARDISDQKSLERVRAALLARETGGACCRGRGQPAEGRLLGDLVP